MLKKITSSLILLFASVSAFSMTCPPEPSFHHVKGQSFTLDEKYVKQGWVIMDMLGGALVQSDLGSLPPDTNVTVSLGKDVFTQMFTPQCIYVVPGFPAGENILMVATPYPIKEENIPVPPFKVERGVTTYSYSCVIRKQTDPKPQDCAWVEDSAFKAPAEKAPQ